MAQQFLQHLQLEGAVGAQLLLGEGESAPSFSTMSPDSTRFGSEITIVPAIRSPPRMRSRLMNGSAAKNKSHTRDRKLLPVHAAAGRLPRS